MSGGVNIELIDIVKSLINSEDTQPVGYDANRQALTRYSEFPQRFKTLRTDVATLQQHETEDRQALVEMTRRIDGEIVRLTAFDTLVNQLLTYAGIPGAAELGQTSVDDASTGRRIQGLRPGMTDAETVVTDYGNKVRSTDTLNGIVRHFFEQRVTELQVGEGSGARIVDVLTRLIFALEATLTFTGRDGTLLELKPQNGTIQPRLSTRSQGAEHQLWVDRLGRVRQERPALPYPTGRPTWTGQVDPTPTFTVFPQLILAEPGSPRAKRTVAVSGAIEQAGGRLWAAWYGDMNRRSEGPGNYLVLAFSDADGAEGTWVEAAYMAFEDARKYRITDMVLWLDPLDILHVLFTTQIFGDVADTQYGVCGITIKNPTTGLPQFGTFFCASTWGIPARPTLIDERWIMPVDLRELPSSRMFPTYTGTTLCEYDYTKRTLIEVGKLPQVDTTVNSFPESSIVQLRDASLMATIRTQQGQYVSRSPSGNPAGPWTPFAPWSALPPNPQSRGRIRMSPSGALIAVFNIIGNDERNVRRNLTIGLSLDGGQTFARTLLLEPRDVSSYPDITFEVVGNDVIIKVVNDRNRFSDVEMWWHRISENALRAGTLTANTPILIDRQGPV